MAKTPSKKTAINAAPAAAVGSMTRKSISKQDDLDLANNNLQTAYDECDRQRAIQNNKLQEKENQLLDRFSKLDSQKLKTASAYGNVDVSDDDVLEINAGGKVIAVKRATMRQLQGSRLEAMFSGRWDKKLVRDGSGRIFLDVNSDCFQAIVDYMNEFAISSEDEPPSPPTVDDELQHILTHQMKLFGISVGDDPQIDSNIITKYSDATILREWLEEDGSSGELGLLYRSSRDGESDAREWLEEDGSSGELGLLYRSSRDGESDAREWLEEDGSSGELSLFYCSSKDGQSNAAFHSKCDNKGPTVVIIETTEGGVIGGYTNTAWHSCGGYVNANKAFLFAVSGFGLSSPCKMKLKNADDQYAICCSKSYGPVFGLGSNYFDLQVTGSTVYLSTGMAYECGPSTQLTGDCSYTIKEMEVFQVTNNNPTPLQDPRKKQPLSSTSVEKFAAVDIFSKKVNDAINEKWITLQELEAELLSLEESFKDEEQFIESFGSGDPNSVAMLNVSGTMMATSRATLLLCEDSVLAQQFDDSKWTEQGSASPRVKNWSPDDITNWVKSVKDVPDDIATLFWENDIKGSELLALNESGLKMIGVKRAGTICLLLKEIKQLEEASQDTATLIEYSPYCFGKMLDCLRLKRLHALGLIDEPAPPEVCESQKKRFEKVVKYYFPGECSKFIFG